MVNLIANYYLNIISYHFKPWKQTIIKLDNFNFKLNIIIHFSKISSLMFVDEL